MKYDVKTKEAGEIFYHEDREPGHCLAEVGSRVKMDDLLAVVKNPRGPHGVRAPIAGTIVEIMVVERSQVETGEVILCLDDSLSPESPHSPHSS